METEEKEAEVTLCVVIGGEGINIIKLIGSINKQPIIVLVDSGGTHSFLDPKFLSYMKITPRQTKPLIVTVANGDKVTCDSMCQGLKWQVQNEVFERDFRLLRFGGCDMV